MSEGGAQLRLRRPVDVERDHLRGGPTAECVVVVIYGDFLCPYCRRLHGVLRRLQRALGDRMSYVFRNFPNERAHPGATFAAEVAEAAGRQLLFWDVYDALYTLEPPLTREHICEAARASGLDMDRFARDLADPSIRTRVDEDLADGRANGVTGTPTIFIDGQRYDGAWDFYSMLEALERPLAARLQRTARSFAALPASGGLVLLLAAAAALICANTGLAPAYRRLVEERFGIGGETVALSLSVADWCAEGLLSLFFLLVGLEIRREMTAGAFADRRAAVLPVVCALGGVVGPALFYLAFNRGPTAAGWAVPTSTGIAFALGVLALLGGRATVGLKVFVAALAVIDGVLSMLTLAIFYPQNFHAAWLMPAGAAVYVMFALNRWRAYAGWPYLAVAIALWLSLHAAGVNAALAGVAVAAFLPTRPAPDAGPLLAQAATALSALEHAQARAAEDGGEKPRIEQEPIWEWASRNLSAASARLLSPAERAERALAPWSAYVILPLFALSATGVPLSLHLRSPEAGPVLLGVFLGQVVGKPLGILAAAAAAVKARIALLPEDTRASAFVGGAILCGVTDPIALVVADRAFTGEGLADVAKIGVLAGSVIAAGLGALVLAISPPPVTPDEPALEPAAGAVT